MNRHLSPVSQGNCDGITSILRSFHCVAVLPDPISGRVLRNVANRRLSHQLTDRLEDVLFAELVFSSGTPYEKVPIVVHPFDYLLLAYKIGLLLERFRNQFTHITEERMLALIRYVQLGQEIPQTLLWHFSVFHEDVPQDQIQQCVLSPVIFAYVQDGTTANGGHQNEHLVPIRFDQLVSVDISQLAHNLRNDLRKHPAVSTEGVLHQIDFLDWMLVNGQVQDNFHHVDNQLVMFGIAVLLAGRFPLLLVATCPGWLGRARIDSSSTGSGG